MATPQSSNLSITETQVFVLPVRTSKRALVILLVAGQNSTPGTEGTVTLDVTPPVTLARMPAGTWAKLWPTKAEPPGWAKVSFQNGKITMTTKTSSTGVIGGIVAFFGPESSLPVNLKTTITYLNDTTTDAAASTTEQGKWNTIFAGMTPRLPLPRVTNVAKQIVSSARPSKYSRRPATTTTRPTTTTTRPAETSETTPPTAPRNTTPTGTVAAPTTTTTMVAPTTTTTVAAPTTTTTVAAPTTDSTTALAPTTARKMNRTMATARKLNRTSARKLKRSGCPYDNDDYDDQYRRMYECRQERRYKAMYSISAILVFLILGMIVWFTMMKYTSIGDAVADITKSTKAAVDLEKPTF